MLIILSKIGRRQVLIRAVVLIGLTPHCVLAQAADNQGDAISEQSQNVEGHTGNLDDANAAASTTESQTPGSRPSENTALEEIVVSATRSGDTLNDTPISVSITSDAELRNTNITDVETLSARLANAQLAVTPTNTFLFIRGLGTGAVRSAEQSVGFFVDGVFLGRPQVALFDFLDVDQVEVLRGPQGAILGKNTVAGAVNVQTSPATREPEGYAEALTGNNGQRRVRGAISGPLSKTLSGRLAYSEVEEDGYLYNTTLDRTDVGRPGRTARGKLRWNPTQNQSYGISLQAASVNQTGDSFEISEASDELLTLYRLFDPETSTDITDNRTHTDNRNSGANIDGQDLIIDADWTPDFGRIRFLGSASRQDTLADFDTDISPVPLLTFPSDEKYRQQSAELRLDKFFGWGDITAGLYYLHSDLDLQVDINAFEAGLDALIAPLANSATDSNLGTLLGTLLGDLGSTLAGSGLFDPAQAAAGSSRHRLVQKQNTLSAFGSVRWYFGERWTLRVDGRLTRETKDGDQSINFEGLTGPVLGFALGEEEYELDAKRSETNFSPRVSLLADITPALSSYITVAQGFKSGGFNNLAAVAERAEFEDERSLTYEAGLRFNSIYRVSGEIGVFRTEFDNLQVASLDGTEFFVGNAARATTQGLELSSRWLIGYGFALFGTFGYTDAEYDEYENAPARASSDADSQDLSGEVLQRAPKYSGSMQLDFTSVLPKLRLPVVLGAVAEGASAQFLAIDLDPIDSQPSYLRYNAFAGISDPSGKLTLKLIGRNLSDEIVRREAGDVALVGAHFVGVYPPRSLAVELGYRF